MNRLFTGSLQAASWQASGDRESKEAVLLLMRGRTMKAYLSGVVKACCSSWGTWMIQPQLKMQHEMRQWLILTLKGRKCGAFPGSIVSPSSTIYLTLS